MILSVIIPVYNVSATLRRCVESVISQSVDGCEIILVNDGSTDDSGIICDALAEIHPEIKVVHYENGGLSAARNRGLAVASGDVITFVDSDDYLTPNTYPPLLQLLDSHPECDILEYNVVQVAGVGGRPTSWPYDKTFASGREYWLQGEAFRHTYACNKIYRRRILFTQDHPSVRFPEGKVFEDVSFLSQLLHYNPCVMTTSLGSYVYQWNEEGITAKAQGAQLRQLLDAQLSAAALLGISFADEFVREEEVPFYLAILNNQIAVCRHIDESPRLVNRKIHLRNVKGLKMKLKALLLNLFGVDFLCKVMS